MNNKAWAVLSHPERYARKKGETEENWRLRTEHHTARLHGLLDHYDEHKTDVEGAS
jgi:hypothetical protein